MHGTHQNGFQRQPSTAICGGGGEEHGPLGGTGKRRRDRDYEFKVQTKVFSLGEDGGPALAWKSVTEYRKPSEIYKN